MNTLNNSALDLVLRAAAIAQFAVAILNLFLIRIMKWKPDLDRAPLTFVSSRVRSPFGYSHQSRRVAEELNDSAPMLPGFEDEFQD